MASVDGDSARAVARASYAFRSLLPATRRADESEGVAVVPDRKSDEGVVASASLSRVRARVRTSLKGLATEERYGDDAQRRAERGRPSSKDKREALVPARCHLQSRQNQMSS